MFSFFKKKPPAPAVPADPAPIAPPVGSCRQPPRRRRSRRRAAAPRPKPAAPAGCERLRQGLRKTGTGIAQVFTGVRIDDALYEELESALLLADTGVPATEYLLADLHRRVKEAKATDPAAVKGLLVDAIADLLEPLERALEVGRESPTVIMVVGVNGAGKTTSIGKLTR